MIKLKSLLKETQEPEDSSQWDDWYNYLDYFSPAIDKDEIIKLVKRFDLNGKKYFDGKLLKLWDRDKTIYLDYDADQGVASLIKEDEISSWLFDNRESLVPDPDIIYNNWVDSSLKDLKENPGKVYHYTTEENWEKIKKDGKIIGSSGTGLNNRYSHGIFTTVDPEQYADGTYGNICLELNLEQFKIDNNLKELNLSFEPDVEDYLMIEYLCSVVEIECNDDISSDISPYTIVVGHSIPLKYIRQI